MNCINQASILDVIAQNAIVSIHFIFITCKVEVFMKHYGPCCNHNMQYDFFFFHRCEIG